MKNAEAKKIREIHTNRLLASVSISLSLLLILLFVHRGQGYSHSILQTQTAVMVLSVAFAITAVLMAIYAVIKKKNHLFEYIAVFVVMAFCFYCLYGVGFITIKLAKYITAAILVAYLVISFIYHTIAPKFAK